MRTLFEEASRRAPCVLFIDELDALGRSRSMGGGGGTEEHDQTLNQLLAMMDGIASRPGVLVIAATNRLAALDSALTRPGRFDRVLQLKLPNEAERLSILQVHAGKTALEDAERVLPGIARRTEGFSGADLSHVVNEAAILAVRAKEDCVKGSHLELAVIEFRASRDTSSGASAGGRGASGAGSGGGGGGQQMEEQLRAWAALLQGLGDGGQGGQGTGGSWAGVGGGSVEDNE